MTAPERPIMLTDAERKKFAAWLHQDAAGDLTMAEQWAKMPSREAPHLDPVVAKFRRDAAAKTLIADLLD